MNALGEWRRARRELPSQWRKVGTFRLHARVSARARGDAVPVVLVHGLGVSSRYMIPIARRLAAERLVLAPDLPNHGRSEKADRALSVPEQAELLRAYLDEVGIERAAFLGNSMGCQTVVELAVRHPARVDRLVLVGPTADRTARTARRQLLRLARSSLAERHALALVVALDYGRMGPRRLLQELRYMLADAIEEKLPLLQCPVLVVRGRRDHIVPQDWTEEVAALARAAPPTVIEGWGHALNFSAPDDLLAVVRPFLNAPVEART